MRGTSGDAVEGMGAAEISELRASARGHRGASDLESEFARGSVDSISWAYSGGTYRNTDGRVAARHANFTVKLRDGSTRTYRIRGATDLDTHAIAKAAKAAGVPIKYDYPKRRRLR